MRALPILALLLTSSAAAPIPRVVAARPTEGVVRLSPDTESRWVPFDLTGGNQIRFALTLDGRTLHAMLDTGVSVSVLSRSSPAVVPAKLHVGGDAHAVGGTVAIEWMPTATIAFGGLTRTGGGVAVTTLPAAATGGETGGAGGAAIDLLVGRDMIGAQAIDIDYAQHRFRLLPSGRLPFTGAIAPLTISAERRVYESAMTLGDRLLRPMVVDTGDGSAVTVTRQGWADAALADVPTTSAIGYGLAGPIATMLAIVPRLRIGALTADAVEVRVEPEGGFSERVGVAGRIGSAFLQKYRVLMDPGAGRMVFQPGPNANVPPIRSTSGLIVGILPDRLRVLHVMANGPAAAAGWRAGEMICRIDGVAIRADYATSGAASWAAAPAGTVVRLGLCDGSERRLTLARFY